ncbi:hypothetical protein GF342_01110 [Candidatus Woesearchaeota archaeon]|nr:hypothetical protein [Candidatus Woesearchaeota archaeon]
MVRRVAMDDAHRIAQAARKSLSLFCSEECRAYCCRRGYLVVPKQQALVLLSLVKDENRVKHLPDSVSFKLKGDCPALVNFSCSVYDLRPQVCRDFPLFLHGTTVMVSGYCTAVAQGKLYPFIAQILRLGYTLAPNNPFAVFDFDTDFKQDPAPDPTVSVS